MKIILYVMLMAGLVKTCAKGCINAGRELSAEKREAMELVTEGMEPFARIGTLEEKSLPAWIRANGIPPLYDGILSSGKFHPFSRSIIKYINRCYNGVHYDSLRNELIIDNKVSVNEHKDQLEVDLKKPEKNKSEYYQVGNNYLRVYKIDQPFTEGILPVSSIYYSDTTVVFWRDLINPIRDTTNFFNYAVKSSDEEYYQLHLVKFDRNNLIVNWKSRTEQIKGLFVKQDLELGFKMTPEIFEQYQIGDTVMLFLNDNSKQVWESSINVLNRATYCNLMSENYNMETLNAGNATLKIFKAGAHFIDTRIFMVRGVIGKVDLTNY